MASRTRLPPLSVTLSAPTQSSQARKLSALSTLIGSHPHLSTCRYPTTVCQDQRPCQRDLQLHLEPQHQLALKPRRTSAPSSCGAAHFSRMASTAPSRTSPEPESTPGGRINSTKCTWATTTPPTTDRCAPPRRRERSKPTDSASGSPSKPPSSSQAAAEARNETPNSLFLIF